MKVIDFIERYVYNTVDHNLFNSLVKNEQVFWLLDQSTWLVFAANNWFRRSWQSRIVEAKNPWGNVLQFHTKHPIFSEWIKFYYWEESVETRFIETGCSCSPLDQVTEDCCECWDNCCYKWKELDVKRIAVNAPLEDNTYKIFWWYAWWGNLWDRVEVKICKRDCCGGTQEWMSIYMAYTMWPTMYTSLNQHIPMPPAYLLPLSFYFKALIIPGMENRAAGQETNYFTLGDEAMVRLDAFDRYHNPTGFISKKR